VRRKVAALNLQLGKCELKIIVQNRCFESWALGNRVVFSIHHTTPVWREYLQFFNVFNNDPELMPKPSNYANSVSEFHYDYLKEMLLQRNIHYTKKHPQDVAKAYYLDNLQRRVQDTPTHLVSLQNFLNFCTELQTQIALGNINKKS